MKKKEYIENYQVQEFVIYFTGLLLADESNNQYKKSFYYIPHTDEKKSGQKGKWGTLTDAALEYSWSKKNVDVNNAELKCISKQLKRTFSSSLEKEALCACIDVIDWGGVQNGAHGIVKLYCENRLIKSITDAIDNLNHEEVLLDGFFATNGGRQKYRMNASFTKIYSLLSVSPFIIYDSRVAAAFGLIVKRFCLENNIVLPELLGFAR